MLLDDIEEPVRKFARLQCQYPWRKDEELSIGVIIEFETTDKGVLFTWVVFTYGEESANSRYFIHQTIFYKTLVLI